MFDSGPPVSPRQALARRQIRANCHGNQQLTSSVSEAPQFPYQVAGAGRPHRRVGCAQLHAFGPGFRQSNAAGGSGCRCRVSFRAQTFCCRRRCKSLVRVWRQRAGAWVIARKCRWKWMHCLRCRFRVSAISNCTDGRKFTECSEKPEVRSTHKLR